MAHVTSFKAGGASGVLKHDERTEKDKVQNRKNECIDNARTHLNYNLAPPRKCKNLMEHIKQTCSENNVRLNNRKDLNVMCSWVVTVPKSVPVEQHPLFFKTCYDFLEERYGKKYTLSAMVHLDETTPHMHYCFLPVGYDKKNDRMTVSSKLVLTRTELKSFHTDLSKKMKEIFGRDIGIENGITATQGNKTTEELKYQTAKKRAEEAQQSANAAEMRLNELQGRVLEQQEIDALKGKKTLTGALKGVSYEEYLSLKKTAQNALKSKTEANKLKEENETLKNAVKDLQKKLEETQTLRIGQEQLLHNKIEKEVEKKYEKYYFEKLNVSDKQLKEITADICCLVRKIEGKFIIKCPFSEKRKLKLNINKVLGLNNKNLHL